MVIELWVAGLFLLLVMIGAVLLLALAVRGLMKLFPATLVAIAVLFLTGSLLLAGLSFMAVATLMAVLR